MYVRMYVKLPDLVEVLNKYLFFSSSFDYFQKAH